MHLLTHINKNINTKYVIALQNIIDTNDGFDIQVTTRPGLGAT
jgi:hypothetical protein